MSQDNEIYLNNFFTFEGGEGSGKSSQAKLLQQAFLKFSIEAILTREPGGTEEAESIRSILLDKNFNFHPKTQLLLHTASRHEHVKTKIIPSLQEGKIVICDRFVDSTLSYQGYGFNLNKALPIELHSMFIDNIMPKLTFILDIDPVEGLKRAKARSQQDSYEKLDLEFHKKVRNGFLAIAASNPNRCFVIDANNDLKKIHQEIINIINTNTNFNLTPLEIL